MSLSSIVFIFLVFIACFFVALAIKTVPQASEFVIERFGRYQKTLKPGLNIYPVYGCCAQSRKLKRNAAKC